MLLHACVSIMIVVLGRRFTGSATGATIAGLLFAVMPIHTEAVANVVGRAELLVAMFSVAAPMCVFRAAESRGWRAVGWRIICGGCCLAAMFGKENGIAAIPIVMATEWMARRSGKRERVRTVVIGYLWLALLVVLYLVMRYRALDGTLLGAAVISRVENPLAEVSPAQRCWAPLQLLGMYVGKTLWPAVLSADYSYGAISVASGPLNGAVLVGLVFCIAMAWALVGGVRRRPGAAVCAAALLATYLPVSNAVVLMKTMFAERLWYGPSVWLTLLVGMLPASMMRRHINVALLAVVLVAGGVRCWVRNADWRDTNTVFAAAYRDQPDAVMTLYNYGWSLIEQGRPGEALTPLERSIELCPEYVDGYRGLGVARARLGDFAGARWCIDRAAEHAPDDPRMRRVLDDARTAVDTMERGARREGG